VHTTDTCPTKSLTRLERMFFKIERVRHPVKRYQKIYRIIGYANTSSKVDEKFIRNYFG